MSEEEKILRTIRYCANDYMKQEDGIQCFEWGDLWVLNEYIENIKQESNQLKDKINTYENPEDLTLMFMYCDEKAKDKIKQLKEVIEEVREYNNQIIKDTKDFYRPTEDKIYSGDCLIDIAEQNISILDKAKGSDK